MSFRPLSFRQERAQCARHDRVEPPLVRAAATRYVRDFCCPPERPLAANGATCHSTNDSNHRCLFPSELLSTETPWLGSAKPSLISFIQPAEKQQGINPAEQQLLRSCLSVNRLIDNNGTHAAMPIPGQVDTYTVPHSEARTTLVEPLGLINCKISAGSAPNRATDTQ